MKQLFLCISMLLCISTIAFAGNSVPLTHQPNGSTHEGNGKAPARPWYISQDASVLTMSATPCAYTLVLCDEAGVVAYTAVLPAATTMVTLPATLSGDYEIRFVADTYYYYGYITL